jgi:ABC-type glutathione transport system ATPase component
VVGEAGVTEPEQGVAAGTEDGRAVPLLELEGVAATYARRRWRALGLVRARAEPELVLRDVSLEIGAGECLGLVGESGSGKSTLGACIAGLHPILAGEVRYRGERVASAGEEARVPRLRGVQAIYQDPFSALNPRRTVGSILGEILRVHHLCPRDEVHARSVALVQQVGLDESILRQRPRSLSGGICQRVAITRALALEPELVIADEVVSALDASVQAQVINLLADLRALTGASMLFITHDLAVVHQLADRVAVLLEGTVVEQGPVDQVLHDPQHLYTQSLLRAVPSAERGG